MKGLQPASSDIAACRALLRHGSKSFHAASLLLPRHVRDPATALYAFCRVADDAIDTSDDPMPALRMLTGRLDAIYTGRPEPHPCDRALAAVVGKFSLPRTLLDALIDGFLWDATGRRYQSLEDVHDYAARVAGTVGVMMAVLMGARAPWTLARAADLGVAMQLTNIARDVGEDARLGRVYLPENWMREEELDPDAFLRAPVFDERLARVVSRLLNEATRLYEQSVDGISALPPECRPAIHAARLIYGDIAREIRRASFDSVNRRAVVSTPRKIALLAESLAASTSRAARRPAPALAATRYLVEAVMREPLPGPRTTDRPAPHPGHMARIVELLAVMQQREAEMMERPRPLRRGRA